MKWDLTVEQARLARSTSSPFGLRGLIGSWSAALIRSANEDFTSWNSLLSTAYSGRREWRLCSVVSLADELRWRDAIQEADLAKTPVLRLAGTGSSYDCLPS